MQEVLCKIVLSLLELVLGESHALSYGNVEGIPLRLHEVQVEEIDDL